MNFVLRCPHASWNRMTWGWEWGGVSVQRMKLSSETLKAGNASGCYLQLYAYLCGKK